MTGIDIVGRVLRADAAVLAAVPIERIKSARLPDGVALPALVVGFTSGVQHQTLKRGPVTRWVDRISVTVRAANERDRARIIPLVWNACEGLAVGLADGAIASIKEAGRGPYIPGPGDTYEWTQDFKVSYDVAS